MRRAGFNASVAEPPVGEMGQPLEIFDDLLFSIGYASLTPHSLPATFVVDPDLFRSALGRFASSVTVLSARDATGKDHGMTVSAFASVSLTPPLVLACVDHVASIHPTLLTQDWIGISILAESQEGASRRFADPDADRFDDLEILRGEHGVALLGGAAVHLECRIVARHEGGDHTIFVASVEQAAVYPGRPLLYYRGGYAQLER